MVIDIKNDQHTRVVRIKITMPYCLVLCNSTSNEDRSIVNSIKSCQVITLQ